MEVIVTIVSKLVYNPFGGLITYLYRGLRHPFTKYRQDIPVPLNNMFMITWWTWRTVTNPLELYRLRAFFDHLRPGKLTRPGCRKFQDKGKCNSDCWVLKVKPRFFLAENLRLTCSFNEQSYLLLSFDIFHQRMTLSINWFNCIVTKHVLCPPFSLTSPVFKKTLKVATTSFFVSWPFKIWIKAFYSNLWCSLHETWRFLWVNYSKEPWKCKPCRSFSWPLESESLYIQVICIMYAYKYLKILFDFQVWVIFVPVHSCSCSISISFMRSWSNIVRPIHQGGPSLAITN